MQPAATVCQDVRRVELSLERGGPLEICVSPGLVTALVFDVRVVVDLEQEVRFVEATRGNTSFSVMPPGDGLAGERFRLVATFPDGESVTFVLLVHAGRATRQVEVYRNRRTRESYQHEVDQERAKVQQLQQEKEALQRQLEELREESGDPRTLRRLIASRSLGIAGISAKEIPEQIAIRSEGAITAKRGITYRSGNRVAVEVWLHNPSDEPWTAVAASLVDAKGNALKGIQLWLEGGSIPPRNSRLVVVEADAGPEEAQGGVTLSIREAGPRGITLAKVMLP